MSPETMEIVLNGRPETAPAESTVLDLVQKLGAKGPGVAVAVNDEIVRREAFARVRLAPGDRVEIIHAVGGG